MSEKKGPFDAAIKTLQDRQERTRRDEVVFDIQSAIRVLEAAGKIDKENAQLYMSGDNAHRFPRYQTIQSMRTLFESLPELEKEKK